MSDAAEADRRLLELQQQIQQRLFEHQRSILAARSRLDSHDAFIAGVVAGENATAGSGGGARARTPPPEATRVTATGVYFCVTLA